MSAEIKGTAINKPFTSQIGGSHYKDLAIQPAEYCQRNRLPYCESAVIRYVTRHRYKNGREDIEKAIHCLQLLLEMEYPDTSSEHYCGFCQGMTDHKTIDCPPVKPDSPPACLKCNDEGIIYEGGITGPGAALNARICKDCDAYKSRPPYDVMPVNRTPRKDPPAQPPNESAKPAPDAFAEQQKKQSKWCEFCKTWTGHSILNCPEC